MVVGISEFVQENTIAAEEVYQGSTLNGKPQETTYPNPPSPSEKADVVEPVSHPTQMLFTTNSAFGRTPVEFYESRDVTPIAHESSTMAVGPDSTIIVSEDPSLSAQEVTYSDTIEEPREGVTSRYSEV